MRHAHNQSANPLSIGDQGGVLFSNRKDHVQNLLGKNIVEESFMNGGIQSARKKKLLKDQLSQKNTTQKQSLEPKSGQAYVDSMPGGNNMSKLRNSTAIGSGITVSV